jgi:hypothetical protein
MALTMVRRILLRAGRLLTEQEVSRSWCQLFSNNEASDETVAKAESLLDELRPESPLRLRLDVELAEIRKRMASAGKS